MNIAEEDIEWEEGETPSPTAVSTPTIVLFGLGSHPVLGELYQLLQSRGRRRVVFVPVESFPTGLEFSLHQADGEHDGHLLVDGEEPILFGDIVSVCLDGYYIVAGGEGLSEEDQEYRQAESWAALVALFKSLSRSSLVANHVVDRDHFQSRLSELYLLHSYGLKVPRTLVTSHAEEARAFIQSLGKVLYRPVMGKDHPFRELLPEDLARLDEVGLAPVHFEEAGEGTPAGCVVVGSRLLVIPDDIQLPASLTEGLLKLCQDLGLHLAEFRLRSHPDGWLVTGLHPFLTMEGLQDPEVVQATLELLEFGLEES